MTRQTPITVTLTAEQVAILLQALEQGKQVHPIDAELIAMKLREAVHGKP